MSIWRRRSGHSTKQDSDIVGFAAGIVKDSGRPASCRLKIGQYRQFRLALAEELQRHGLAYPGLDRLLAGKLVGVCLGCQSRWSAEFLEWLQAADPTASRSWRDEVTRFQRGVCVNPECTSGDMVLYWHQ
jgi:hypothetical protein